MAEGMPPQGVKAKVVSPGLRMGAFVVGGLILLVASVAAVLLLFNRESLPPADRGPDMDGPSQTADRGNAVKQARELLPDNALANLKAATVFLKVVGSGIEGSGTGFVAWVDKDKAYVATNYHVINPKVEIMMPRHWPGSPPSRRPPILPFRRSFEPAVNVSVTAVFWSGTKKELALSAKMVSSDPDHDLALLLVTGIKNPPPALALQETPILTELMPVFVFGFPFGKVLASNKRNPAITVGKGSVSSIRLDEQDELAYVQIDGSMNPGNSGGPVVDRQGRVIGIAVATVRDSSGIGLAIPAKQLRRLLDRKEKLPAPNRISDRRDGKDPNVGVIKPPQPQADVALPKINPPALASETVVKRLPESVADLAVGGGGRYLVLHFPKLRKLGLFDMTAARIVRYFPAPDEKTYFAANASNLIVVLGNAGIIQRWDLATGQRALVAPLSFVKGQVSSICMGSASGGPLLVHWSPGDEARPYSQVDFVDEQSLKPLKMEHERGSVDFSRSEVVHFRASADGQVFGAWCSGQTPSTVKCLILRGNRIIRHQIHESSGHVIPSPDGRILYTARGRYTNELSALDEKLFDGTWFMPAHDDKYYFSFRYASRFNPQHTHKTGLTVFVAGDTRPLFILSGIPIPPSDLTERFGVDKRIHFIPKANLVAVLPATSDQVVLYRLDLDEALEKSGFDYLVVDSRPPLSTRRGSTYLYQLSAKSKKGGLKYRLDSGPEAMRITPEGRFTWAVPLDYEGAAAEVIVTIADRTGQQVFHTFTITIPAIEASGRKKVAEEGKTTKGLEPDPSARDHAWLAIKPPEMKEAKVVRHLPASIRDVAVGGGGRFLILHLPQLRKLAVFDVNQAKVVHYIPLASDQVRFAAGLDKLLVAFADHNIVQRWSLRTFEREATARIRIKQYIAAVGMGSASAGPLFIYDSRTESPLPLILDIQTLKPIDPGKVERSLNTGMTLRVSADGKTFCLAGNQGRGLTTIVAAGKSFRWQSENPTAPYFVPAPDGNVIFAGPDLYTDGGKLLRFRGDRSSWAFPACDADYYFRWLNPGAGPRDANKTGVSIHLLGDNSPLTSLYDIRELQATDKWKSPDIFFDKRIHLIPDAKLLVTIPASDDRLVLHRFDVDEALKNSGRDYLLVTPGPAPSARKGGTFAHQIKVKSKKGGVKFALDSAPKGMQISKSGLVTWSVPSDYPDREITVILSISDRGDQEIFHTFKLAILAKGLPNDG